MRFDGRIYEVDIEDDDLKRFVREGFYPEDIFTDDQLEEWAKKNGFIKEDYKDAQDD